MDLSNLKPPKGAKHFERSAWVRPGLRDGCPGRPWAPKGAKSRSGFTHKTRLRGWPRCAAPACAERGFHNIFREEYEVVNLDTLEERFEAGGRRDGRIAAAGSGLVGRAGA